MSRIFGFGVLVVSAAVPAQSALFRYQLDTPDRATFAPAGDADGDGVTDWFLHLSSTAGDSVHLFSGADGTLVRTHRASVLAVADAPLADFNGDGRADYVLGTASAASAVSGATSQPLYGVSYSGTVPFVREAQPVATGDVDGDGVRDFALVYSSSAGPTQIQQVSARTGRVLLSYTSSAGFVGTRPVSLGDVDGDGAVDFGVVALGGRITTVTVHSSRTGAVLASLVSAGLAAADDVNGDGRAEFFTIDQSLMNPGLELRDALLPTPLARWSRFGPQTVATVGDLDGDGVRDFTIGRGRVATFYSGATRATLATQPLLFYGDFRAMGDVDGDGAVDLAVMSARDLYLHTSATLDLSADTMAHSASTASTVAQTLVLDAPAALGGAVFAMFGSLSGTRPGFSVGGLTIPLNIDAYTVVTAGLPANGLLQPPVGLLDPQGDACVLVLVPPIPALAGRTLHHAYTVLNAAGLVHASRAVPFALLP